MTTDIFVLVVYYEDGLPPTITTAATAEAACPPAASIKPNSIPV